MRCSRRDSESGSALLIVLILMAVVASAAALRFDRHAIVERDTRLELARLQARCAAEGALEVARVHLERGEQPPASVQIGECTVALQIRRTSERAGHLVITARAVRSAEPRVSILVKSRPAP